MTGTQVRILAVLGGLVALLGVFSAVVFALDPGSGRRTSVRATATLGAAGAPEAPATRTIVATAAAFPTVRPATTPTPAATVTVTATPGRGGFLARAPGVANVRGGPGVEFSVLATLRPGDELPVSGRNAEGSWLLVTHDLGTGWVASDVVDVVGGALSALPVLPTPTLPRPVVITTPAPTAEPTQPARTAIAPAPPAPTAPRTVVPPPAPAPVQTAVPTAARTGTTPPAPAVVAGTATPAPQQTTVPQTASPAPAPSMQAATVAPSPPLMAAPTQAVVPTLVPVTGTPSR